MATLTNIISIAPSYSGTWSKQQHMQSVGANTWANPKNYELWGWGYNGYGSLGQNDTINRSSPVQIGSADWAAIAGGSWFILAIKTDGTLWAWGYNFQGALGNNSAVSKSSPVQVSALTNWLSISAGAYHSTALKNDGTLWTWGKNSNYGQLGDGTVINRYYPVQIGTSLDKWVFVTASEEYTIAIKGSNNARTLWTWGYNQYGQLGSGTVVNRSSPVQLGGYNLIGDITWASASAGRSHVLAVKTDGTLWSWGRNQAGQLGDNTAIYKSSPIQVGAMTNWSITSSGVYHCIAIKTDGTLWSWGLNNLGQLGINNQTNKSSPTQVGALTDWLSISAGYSSSVALKTDGTIWSWGNSNAGQLGLGISSTYRSSPIQIGTKPNWKSLPSSGGTNNAAYALTIPAGASTWTAPSQANYLWVWGVNDYGQLGLNLTGTAGYRSSPTQIGLTQFLSVSGSYQSVSGIRPNGTLWTWGKNDYGQAGQNSLVNTTISSPVQVGALTDWVVSNTNFGHTLALKINGTLWAWGYNQGQIGDGTIIDRSSPVQIGALTDWSKVYAGYLHSVAIKTDGTLWAWGRNDSGALGLGDTINRLSPVQLGVATNWASAAAGQYYTLGIKTDGTLWAWGRNYYGNLGLGDKIYRSSPVQVGALTNWFSSSASNHVLATKTDGTLWSWGNNGNGQLGLNDGVYRSSPVQVGALTNWSKAYAGGGNHSISIKTDNTLWAWGLNTSGQLGDGTVINRSSPVQIGASIDWSSSIIIAGYGHSAAISKITIY